jgi:hypothetical protein
MEGWMVEWSQEMRYNKDDIKIRVVVMNIIFTENDWFKCHLCFILFLGTSIHPSIYVISHRLSNILMVPFKNPPD